MPIKPHEGSEEVPGRIEGETPSSLSSQSARGTEPSQGKINSQINKERERRKAWIQERGGSPPHTKRLGGIMVDPAVQ